MINTMSDKIKKFDQFINEGRKEMMVEISFPDNKNYSKGISSLYDHNFMATGFVPPQDEFKYFTRNDYTLTIEFKKEYENEIVSILNSYNIDFNLQHKKPLDYKVFYHGGYYD